MANDAVRTPAAAVVEPATLPTPRSFGRTGSVGQRTLKMIAARCSICQDGKNVPADWWESCQHEKYTTAIPTEVQVPKYEPELVDGEPTGRSRLIGTDTVVEWKAMPNWKEVAVSPRINQGRGYHRNRWKGAIMPEDLRTTAFPAGGKPVCQFRGCFEMNGLVEYPNVGVFHMLREAQLVWFDKEGKTLEYNNASDADSVGKRASMLAAAPVMGGRSGNEDTLLRRMAELERKLEASDA